MDRLAAMHLFVRVAELGSFAAVAQQLNVARSVVTRQIAALEEHLGAKLMARSTRRLTLTSAGSAYLEKCRVILNLVDAAEAGVAEERQALRGPIRLGLPLSYGLKRLAPWLLGFARRYPEVVLDMDYSDRRINLIEEGVDVAIRITHRLAGQDVVRRIGSERMRVVAAPEYLARHGRPQKPEDLPGHQCLGYTSGGSLLPWQFGEAGKARTLTLPATLSASNGDVLAEAAAQGLGITCQPDFIIADLLAGGRLEAILCDHPVPLLGIYAVFPGNRQVPHRVRVLVDELAAWLTPEVPANRQA